MKNALVYGDCATRTSNSLISTRQVNHNRSRKTRERALKLASMSPHMNQNSSARQAKKLNRKTLGTDANTQTMRNHAFCILKFDT
jgi:hypothetical protein